MKVFANRPIRKDEVKKLSILRPFYTGFLNPRLNEDRKAPSSAIGFIYPREVEDDPGDEATVVMPYGGKNGR